VYAVGWRVLTTASSARSAGGRAATPKWLVKTAFTHLAQYGGSQGLASGQVAKIGQVVAN